MAFLAPLWQAFKLLNPTFQFRNPEIFATYTCAIFTTLYSLVETVKQRPSAFDWQIAFWLWLTVIFANLVLVVAKNKGKAQALNIRKSQINANAHKLIQGAIIQVTSADLKAGDIVLCDAGDIIPADGEVIVGLATVDESAITGESAPVIREAGGDRNAVTAGTQVVSDRIVIKITTEPGRGFTDRIIELIEGGEKRRKTPNEVALNSVLSGFSIIFLLCTMSLKFFSDYIAAAEHQDKVLITIPILIALFVCLLPTTISALLNVVGIASMQRLIRKNVVAKNERAVEIAGDIDLLLLDKTGTITLGNRIATAFLPAEGVTDKELATVAQLSSLADETSEGRSIVVLAKSLFDLRGESLEANVKFIPFNPATGMSGLDFFDANGRTIRQIRKGTVEAIKKHVERLHGTCPEQLTSMAESIARKGGTPFFVSDQEKILGIIYLKDTVKGGLKERFVELRKMGIRTVMITGDNNLTAAAIAAEAGVDDFIAEATPEMKMDYIRKAQAAGLRVAMAGDGTNDAPALAQANLGLTMNTGTQASREAGNMVDLDSNPTKLIDIVEIGTQLLMTRGSLTTFSIANGVANYFTILPAMFSGYFSDGDSGPLAVMNIMQLQTPQSAILSALIFNAAVIIALLPVALRGIELKHRSGNQLLQKNLLQFGFGGLILPFFGIKLIDIVLNL